MQEKWFEIRWKAGFLSVPEILRHCKKNALKFRAVNILKIIIIVLHNIMKHKLKTEVPQNCKLGLVIEHFSSKFEVFTVNSV